MKKLAAALIGVLLVAAPAAAEVRTFPVCQNKTLSASNANLYGLGNGITDCKYEDISAFTFFSVQISCTDANDSAIIVSADWLGGGDTGKMGIPLLVGGSAMGQLITARTTETTWSTLQSVQPPVSPVGSIRLTNGETDTDVTCSVNIYAGN